jgi:hypothetical protein
MRRRNPVGGWSGERVFRNGLSGLVYEGWKEGVKDRTRQSGLSDCVARAIAMNWLNLTYGEEGPFVTWLNPTSTAAASPARGPRPARPLQTDFLVTNRAGWAGRDRNDGR